MPYSENDLRDYIWNNRDRWPELIAPLKGIEPYEFAPDLSDLTPERLATNRVLRRISEIYDAVCEMRLIGRNVPFSREDAATIYPDLLGRFPDDDGLGVIELKIGNRTARESFTELLGYANHLSGTFYTLCNGDVYHILIAPLQGRIVREAILHSLMFDRKRVLALIPTTAGDDLSTLTLVPWVPSVEEIRPIARMAFAPKNFTVEKGVWAEDGKRWSGGALNSVASLASQLMESEGIHGFVYCSKDFPEANSQLPNALVIAGLNPFEVAHHLYCVEEMEVENEDVCTTHESHVRLTDLLPGLAKDGAEEGDNFLRLLSRYWLSHLVRVRGEIIGRCLQRNDAESLPRDRGAMNWEQLQNIVPEDRMCRFSEVRPTGIMRELFWDYTQEYYRQYPDIPPEYQPDLFRYAGEAVADFGWFRQFVHRMIHSR